MTDLDDEPTREEAVYAFIAGFLRRHGFAIALVAPLVLISVVPMGSGGVLLVLLIYLGEAIVYAAMQRTRRGIRSGPRPALQALWVGFASLLIMGGLFGLVSGEPASIIAVALGIGIVAWMWSRVARASGEDSRRFMARVAGHIVGAGVSAVGILVVSTVALAIGLPGVIVILVAVGVGVGFMTWILSKTLR